MKSQNGCMYRSVTPIVSASSSAHQRDFIPMMMSEHTYSPPTMTTASPIGVIQSYSSVRCCSRRA